MNYVGDYNLFGSMLATAQVARNWRGEGDHFWFRLGHIAFLIALDKNTNIRQYVMQLKFIRSG